jgi:hypothetical protein
MNQTFNLSVERVRTLLFTNSEFMRRYMSIRKCENVKLVDPVDGTSHAEYICNLGAFGKSHNFEEHVRKKKG